MITPADFITVPYTPDMTRGGIAYACKSLHYTYNRMGSSAFKRLRRIAAGIAVELAFRRYLTQERIPHGNLGATPFTDPDKYDIEIGGRRCDIKSFIFSYKKRIRLIHNEPGCLLDAAALVPVDQIASAHLYDKDLYIFAFLTALFTPNQHKLQKAIRANQPIYLIHSLPEKWARRKNMTPLGKLVLKSAASQSIEVKLGGQNHQQTAISEQVILKPEERVTVEKEFCSLHYLHTPTLPDGPVGVHSPILKETHVIAPIEWGNIWVYGLRIIFTGYMTRGEFRQRAKNLSAGSRVFQYPRTRTDNLSLPISELHSLTKLFEKAKTWRKS
ncbi:MAG: hypothetical protein U9Q82_03825 [Chloroflexota bacterium]|nr:hypothetical protein [Chloroflexota bacterium]